jgi:hypothetical protein
MKLIIALRTPENCCVGRSKFLSSRGKLAIMHASWMILHAMMKCASLRSLRPTYHNCVVA